MGVVQIRLDLDFLDEGEEVGLRERGLVNNFEAENQTGLFMTH